MRILILLPLLILSACATTETPQSIAAKTLLTSRQAVIGAAKTTDALCKSKTLSPADCAAAKKAYEQYQVCYNSVSDTFILYVHDGKGDYNMLVNEIMTCQQSFGGVK